MSKKKPPSHLVLLKKPRPSNVRHMPGAETAEEVLDQAKAYALENRSDWVSVMVIIHDEKRGFEFISTELSPDSHCRFSMELAERVRFQFLQKYFFKKPDPEAG